MGCRLSDFIPEGPWLEDTIHGHKVQMVRARYKSGSIKDLGTSYKVDGTFRGHMPFGDFAAVRSSLLDDLDPAKIAADQARRAEVEADFALNNRIQFKGREILDLLTACADALDDEANCPSNVRAETRQRAIAMMAHIQGKK